MADSGTNPSGGDPDSGAENRSQKDPNSSWARPVFGINKHGVSRAIVHFRQKPQPAPLAVCLHYPDTILSHKHLLKLIKATLERIPEAEVKSIHFVDRNVLFGAREIENRWIVTVGSNQARDELIRSGIVLYEKKIQFKKYDEILATEFDQFLRHMQLKKDMFMKVEEFHKD
jgi:hypothetical protein